MKREETVTKSVLNPGLLAWRITGAAVPFYPWTRLLHLCPGLAPSLTQSLYVGNTEAGLEIYFHTCILNSSFCLCPWKEVSCVLALKIWGGAQESEEQTLPRKTSIWENPRFKNSWTREARNQYYLVLLSTPSYNIGIKDSGSQKRIQFWNFDKYGLKTFLSFRLPVSLWLSFLPVPSFSNLSNLLGLLWLTCPLTWVLEASMFHRRISCDHSEWHELQ